MEAPTDAPVWWVLSPDGDIFSELMRKMHRGVLIVERDDVVPRMRRNAITPESTQVEDLKIAKGDTGRHGVVAPLIFAQAVASAVHAEGATTVVESHKLETTSSWVYAVGDNCWQAVDAESVKQVVGFDGSPYRVFLDF